jgi:hypothetical protein
MLGLCATVVKMRQDPVVSQFESELRVRDSGENYADQLECIHTPAGSFDISDSLVEER